MISLFITAFLLGALGSVHCVGMCGPIALSIPFVNKEKKSKVVSAVLYNTGRAFMYALFGILFGIIGKTFALFGFQQGLSIALGIIILIFLIFHKRSRVLEKSNFLVHFFYRVRQSLGKLFTRRNYKSAFFIGLLNGLLPCGLVYMAIAGAIATASVLKSSLFMAFFGFGTFPLMLGVIFFGSFLNVNTRQKIRAAYPYFMFIMACLLIIRGLGLGIPYISPGGLVQNQNVILCH